MSPATPGRIETSHQTSTPSKSAISSGCESHPATRSLVSVIGCVLVLISHIGDPVAVVVVSNDPTTAFTADAILQLTEAAMRDAGLTPIAPAVFRGNSDGDERFIGRNTITPNDRATVNWWTGGMDKPTYG